MNKGPSHLWLKFSLAAAWLAGIAGLNTAITRQHFGTSLLVTAAGAVAAVVLLLIWATGWALANGAPAAEGGAQRNDGRPGQFRLVSLLLATLVVAAYFGVVRWLVQATLARSRFDEASEGELFAIVAIYALIVAIFSVPALMLLAESLVWFAVWLVRRPTVRRLLKRRL